MREIKFRTYNKKYKMMSNFFTLQNAVNGETQGADFTDSVFMQYTGQKDKNGVEIYEGDIVKRESENGVVRWDEQIARFRVYMDNNNPMPRNYPLWSELLEVIGNIYENSELINSSEL